MAGLFQPLAQHQLTSLHRLQHRSQVSTLRCTSRHSHAASKPTRGRVSVCQAASSGIAATPPVPEGDVDIPLLTSVRNTLEWLADYPAFYQRRFEKYGGLFRTNLLFNPMVVVTDETEVRRLLQAEHKLVESAWPQSMRNLLGPNAILTATAKTHKKQRQILSQAFTEAAMRLYLPTILDVSRYTMEQWTASKDPVLFYSAARAFAFDIAATVLTGTRFDGGTLVKMREAFDVYSDGLFSLPFNIPGTPYGKAVKAREYIVAEIESLILAAKASNEAQSSGRRNALRLLLDAQDENGEKLSMEQLKDQILTQLFAGHETTGATLSRVLPELQKQPHIMVRLRQEQAELIEKYGEEITYDMLEQMPYLDAVLKEVMRMHGIVDGVWRQALEDLEVQGCRVPKGWTVQLMVKQAGLSMPDFKGDADRFNPSRWLEDGAPLKKEPKGFMPFGEGPRKCLGMLLAKMEMRVLLAVLARDYTVELEDPHEVWVQGFKPVNKLPGRVLKYQV